MRLLPPLRAQAARCAVFSRLSKRQPIARLGATAPSRVGSPARPASSASASSPSATVAHVPVEWSRGLTGGRGGLGGLGGESARLARGAALFSTTHGCQSSSSARRSVGLAAAKRWASDGASGQSASQAGGTAAAGAGDGGASGAVPATAGDGGGGEEAETAERLAAYKDLLVRRGRVIGGVFGIGSLAALAVYPPVASTLFLSTDLTTFGLAAAVAGSYYYGAGMVYRRVVSAGEPNRPGSYGTISVMEGMVIGLFTGVFSHLVVPGAVFALPTVLEFGLANWGVVDWVTQLPLDLWRYGGTLAWWGVVQYGLYTLPASAALGMLLSAPCTHAVDRAGLATQRLDTDEVY